MNISSIYRSRFPQETKSGRASLWRELCRVWFGQYVSERDTVMDIGAGYCEFINAIRCKAKIAVDINLDVRKHAHSDVTVLQTDVLHIPKGYKNSVDVIFMSNFLEHLPKRDDVVTVLAFVKSLLKHDGTLLILQPNIDLVKERYWDFIDHYTALNEKSLTEALALSGYRVEIFVKRFLPYSTVATSFSTHPWFIRAYFLLPQWLRPFAGQSFVVARKTP